MQGMRRLSQRYSDEKLAKDDVKAKVRQDVKDYIAAGGHVEVVDAGVVLYDKGFNNSKGKK